MGNGCEPGYTMEQEMQQAHAEHQAYLWHCLTQAREGKATAEEWEEIESACGFTKSTMLASQRYLKDGSEDEFIPF